MSLYPFFIHSKETQWVVALLLPVPDPYSSSLRAPSESGSTKYRCHTRSGPRTWSSRRISLMTGSYRSSAISYTHDLPLSRIPKPGYRSLLALTRLTQNRSQIKKSKGCGSIESSAIVISPRAFTLCRVAYPAPHNQAISNPVCCL